jgi:hypothetical protein
MNVFDPLAHKKPCSVSGSGLDADFSNSLDPDQDSTKSLDPDPDSAKCLDPDPGSVNPDPKHSRKFHTVTLLTCNFFFVAYFWTFPCFKLQVDYQLHFKSS